MWVRSESEIEGSARLWRREEGEGVEGIVIGEWGMGEEGEGRLFLSLAAASEGVGSGG